MSVSPFANAELLCGIDVDVEVAFAAHHFSLAENQERYLLFFERDPKKAEKLLSSDEGREILTHPRVRYYLLEPGKEEELFLLAAWQFVFLQLAFLPLTPETEKIAVRFAHFVDGVHSFASFYADRGEHVVLNFHQTLRDLARSHIALEGKGQFAAIPAVICGAGASLETHLDFLSKIREKAFIFGGGSGLPILSKGGIVPHFAASIDPKPPYDRFAAYSGFEAPFFYLSHLSEEILRLVHAPLYWVGSPGAYPVPEWVAQELKLPEGVFDSGWNVVTFCLSLALFFGCDPIILVGVDLAGKEQPGWISVTSAGKEVFTKRDFLLAADWIDETFKKRKDRTLLNISKEGLFLESAQILSAEEVERLYLQKSYDLEGLIHARLSSHTFPVASQGESARLGVLFEQSIWRSLELCQGIMKQIERSFPANPEEKGEIVLLELDLEEEIVYKLLLKPLWDVWHFVFDRKEGIVKRWEHGGFLNKILFWQNTLSIYRRDNG